MGKRVEGKSVGDPKKWRQAIAELQIRGQGQSRGTQHRSGKSSCFPDSSRPCKESEYRYEGRCLGSLPGSKERVTLNQRMSFPVSASNSVLSPCLPLVSVCILPRLPPLGRRRGCWGRLKTETRLGTVTLSHPQSDESSFQLNPEAWGKGIRTDPLGAVPLLGAEIWAALSRGANPRSLWSP